MGNYFKTMRGSNKDLFKRWDIYIESLLKIINKLTFTLTSFPQDLDCSSLLEVYEPWIFVIDEDKKIPFQLSDSQIAKRILNNFVNNITYIQDYSLNTI